MHAEPHNGMQSHTYETGVQAYSHITYKFVGQDVSSDIKKRHFHAGYRNKMSGIAGIKLPHFILIQPYRILTAYSYQFFRHPDGINNLYIYIYDHNIIISVWSIGRIFFMLRS